jgi:hypothetical protein
MKTTAQIAYERMTEEIPLLSLERVGLTKVNLKKIKEVYKKYYNFDNFYISNDKKEFKQ